MEIKVRTKEQQAIDNLKAIVNSKDKIIEIEPPIEDTAQILLDIITNLEEELEDLREDNYAYHQLMKMQNKREYRSKFLKEFQEEFGTNTFPDYDEIYKRYDKIKKENERLKENAIHNDKVVDKAKWNEMIYKSRCEKAINILELSSQNKGMCTRPETDTIQSALIILKGDKDEL